MSMKKVSDDGVVFSGQLGEVKVIEERRPNGSLRIAYDYSACPSQTEVHSAHLTDINYLVKKYKPDELAAYIMARSQYRHEILGEDFSLVPSLQDGMNVVAHLRSVFNGLPDNVRRHFNSPSEFFRFVDNPANADRLVDLGLFTRKQVDEVKSDAVVAKLAEPSSANP